MDVETEPDQSPSANDSDGNQLLKTLMMCPICKKEYSFQSGSNMSKHMAKHALVKQHQCKQCEKYFSTNGVLKTHMRSHAGEKPFNCKHCQMSFSDLSNRNQHERRHVRENSVFKEERDLFMGCQCYLT